jgi:hypothetical protein
VWKEIPRVPAFALSPLYARRDAERRAFSRTPPRDLYVGNEVGVILRLFANTERIIIGISECIRIKFKFEINNIINNKRNHSINND